MSNSALATYAKLSPNCNKPRLHEIDTITIHTMAGNMSAQSCAAMFADSSLATSCNYAIGSDGKIALIVEEANRSWCSSSSANDHRAVTIEVASLTIKEPFDCSPEAMESLIKLCADICKRNKIDSLRWRGEKGLIGQVDKQNMTVHRWFAAKSCPGEYLYEKMGYIANEVNKRLGSSSPTNYIPERPEAVREDSNAIVVGAQVMVTGRRYSTGSPIAEWVKRTPHPVSRVDSTRTKALLGAEGGINSWVDIKDLQPLS
jgi:hypothetical protein